MTKIWAEVFWKTEPEGEEEAPPLQNPPLGSLPYLILPIAVLATITVIIGLFSEPFFMLATHAAEQLLNPGAYIEAVRPVLGGSL
jgi:multicomponent Na+:H+ antiporter subunit D